MIQFARKGFLWVKIMKVLALSSKDATNLRLAKIVSKLLEKGHEVLVYGTSLETHNIRMLVGLIDEVKPIEALSDQVVSACDVIFCANDTVEFVKKYERYIFIYNIASILGTAISEGGDFMFLPNDMQYVYAKEHCASMVVGNPMYEKKGCSTTIDTEKNILFIDCGHYPFGQEGKRKLAELIVEICKRYPEYTMKIKPRFLEGNKEGRTHNNRLHLYECIRNVVQGTIPINLQLLDYHEEMNVLIDWAGLVICPYTTAYVDAIAQNKRLLVLSGLPNEDSVNLNSRFWETEREIVQRTGCLVDYRDIFEYLPEGRYCNEEEKNRLIPYKEGAADRIVEVMEFIWNCILTQAKLPVRKRYQYTNYRQEMIEHTTVCNWDIVLRERARNLMVYEGTRYLDAIPYPLDVGYYVSWIDSVCDKCNSMMCMELKEVNRKYIQYMIIDKADSLLETAIDQSYLMQAYFLVGKFGEFEQKYLSKLKCIRAYPYYKGRCELSKGNYKNAELYLDEYISDYGNFEWEEYLTDYVWIKEIAVKERREIFPFSEVKEASRVILYGAGELGKKYWMQAKDYCDILCIADQNIRELFCYSMRMVEPGEITGLEFDKIVICLRDEKIGWKVRQELLELGIQDDNIVYR